MRILGYLIMPNHWHLVLWPDRERGFGQFHAAVDGRARAALALAPPDRRLRTSYQGTYKSFPIETDEHLLTVLGYVERNALRAGLVEARRTGAVKPMALAARRSNGRCAAADGVARRATTTMVDAGEPVATPGGAGSGASLGATRPSLRQYELAGNDRRETRPRINLSTSRTATEARIIGLIPFFTPPTTTSTGGLCEKSTATGRPRAG